MHFGKITFDDWKSELAAKLARAFGVSQDEGRKYVEQCGDECWRECYDDGMTPSDSADEETHASASML